MEKLEVERLVPKHKKSRSELSRVNWIALPMMVVTVSQFLLRVSPMFMLGHLDQLSLSSASIATSLCSVTGYSVLFGMSSALETLCGQAFGAKQYKKVGTFTYGAILCLLLVCLPLSLLFMLTQKLLLLTGQDPVISAAAGKFAIQLIPTLFPYACLQCLVRYLQSQSLIFPMVWTSLASLCFQIPLCWAFIFKLNLGNTGATISIALSSWFNVALLLLYVMHSPACQETRAPFSTNVFAAMRDFFHLAIPSAAMSRMVVVRGRTVAVWSVAKSTTGDISPFYMLHHFISALPHPLLFRHCCKHGDLEQDGSRKSRSGQKRTAHSTGAVHHRAPSGQLGYTIMQKRIRLRF